MKPRSSDVEHYSGPAVALHWLIALLIICGFYIGWIMTDIPGFTPTKLKYFSWHKWIGVTVFRAGRGACVVARHSPRAVAR